MLKIQSTHLLNVLNHRGDFSPQLLQFWHVNKVIIIIIIIIIDLLKALAKAKNIE